VSGARLLALAAVSVAAVLAACSPDAPPPPATSTTAAAAGGAASFLSDATPEHPGAPDRFAFGSTASADRVALWDVDVKPDGEGLPAGRGSVAEGRRLFEIHCIACHGPTGTEGPNDRLVGREPWEDVPTTRTVGNYWPYATTLFDYIRRAMPQLTPGILTADQTYAVIAYLLYLNEIVDEDAVMSETTLPTVEMPARDRFVVDDREGGPGPVR
jgi:mono/diheme cytochrome c family protein